ncbi:MAG: zinc metallopeptidase [Wenzhouxiangellaceae bacterium]
MHILLILLLLLGLLTLPSFWVRRVMKKYSQPEDRYPGSGADLARRLLDEHGLNSVAVEVTDSGDHYDPEDRCVRLTSDKYHGRSLTAITVAAHEVGHALQDHSGYQPLKLRTHLVRLAGPAQKLGATLLFAAPVLVLLTRALPLSLLMFVGGLLTLGFATIIHFVTLPTEWDASFGRAMPLLQAGEYLYPVDVPHARRLLLAAAMTYVAASLMSLLNIGRWWAILRR